MRRLPLALIAAACTLASSTAWAQSAVAVSTKSSNGGSVVGGSAGSAAAGGTSVSTIGLGANSVARASSSSSIGGAASAAAVGGRTMASTRIGQNPQMLRAHSRARAWDGGTWSRSMSGTTVRHDGGLRSSTMSMAHVPGSKPVIARARVR